jgi:hypothetical protein
LFDFQEQFIIGVSSFGSSLKPGIIFLQLLDATVSAKRVLFSACHLPKNEFRNLHLHSFEFFPFPLPTEEGSSAVLYQSCFAFA